MPLGTDLSLRLKSKRMLIVLDFNSIRNICDKYDYANTTHKMFITFPQGGVGGGGVDHAFLAIFTNVFVGIILVNFSITP